MKERQETSKPWMLLLMVFLVPFLAFASPTPEHIPRWPLEGENLDLEEIFRPLDDEVPWPWADSRVVQFPWSTIDGLFVIRRGNQVAYFLFERPGRTPNGVRLLSIKQIDPRNGEIRAEGLGIEQVEAREVIAVMRSHCAEDYRVAIRVHFGPDDEGVYGQHILMSVGPEDGLSDWYYHFELEKMDQPVELREPTLPQQCLP